MEYDPNIEIAEDDEVYPPSEDSILLIESLNISPGERVLEIGCGSGVVSIHSAKNGAIVTCGDLNPRAVELTKRNAESNGVLLDVRMTDVYDNISGIFDTVIFNLPYLPVEEEGLLAKAWSGGSDGLGPLPKLLDGSDGILADDGRIVIVVSSLMDDDALNGVLKDWDANTLGSLPLFFEKLHVLELRRK